MKQILLLDPHFRLAAPADMATVHDHISALFQPQRCLLIPVPIHQLGLDQE